MEPAQAPITDEELITILLAAANTWFSPAEITLLQIFIARYKTALQAQRTHPSP